MQNPRRDFDALFHAFLGCVAKLSPEGLALVRRFDAILDDFATDSPEARALVNKFRRHHEPGRPAKAPFLYRRLERMWRNFLKDNSKWSEKQARIFFLHHRGQEIGGLGLDINTPGSLRDAVAKGEKASAEVRAQRREQWRVVPEFQGGVTRSTRRMLVTDPQRAAYLNAMRLWGFSGMFKFLDDHT
jgi:hypothetical protein